MLLTRFDLEVVSGRGRLVGILDLDLSSKRKVTVRVSEWIWLAVRQVGKEYTLVIICNKTSLLDCQRVDL